MWLACFELQDLKVIKLQPAQAKALDFPDRQRIVTEGIVSEASHRLDEEHARS